MEQQELSYNISGSVNLQQLRTSVWQYPPTQPVSSRCTSSVSASACSPGDMVPSTVHQSPEPQTARGSMNTTTDPKRAPSFVRAEIWGPSLIKEYKIRNKFSMKANIQLE